LAIPQTYMNLSGFAVKDMALEFEVAYENIAIIYDDYSIPLGMIRIRDNGSAGGHNGIKSVLENEIKTFVRVRVGTGTGASEDKEKVDLGEYVLGHFTRTEMKTIDIVSAKMGILIMDLITSGLSYTQNKFNKLIF
jgi:PTH1 family peptidyl-tRNA hydrolase